MRRGEVCGCIFLFNKKAATAKTVGPSLALRQMVFNRSEWAYRERLGLAPGDHHLVADVEPRAVRAPRVLGTGPFVSAWRNYMKTLLKPTCFYAFEAKPDVLFYILENKTLAGREDRSEEGHQEAPGRKVTLCFFARVAELPGHVRHAVRGSSALTPSLLTLAEILHTVGLGPPLDPEKGAAEQEILAEALYDTWPLLRYDGEETEGPERLLFLLGEGSNTEDAYLGDTGRTLTKMTLARCLQRNGALGAGESLNSAWNQTLARLQARAAAWLPVVAPPAAPPAARGGRGGAARGRGGGRGGAARGRGR